MTTEASPKPRQRVSRHGLQLIKSFEGLRRKSARLPGDRYVVGYGHTRSARQGVEVSEADAEALLRYDLLPVEAAVNEWTFTPLTQNQFDALVSFAFNIGLKAFRRSDVLRRLNEGAMLPAAAALEMWRRAELDGEGVLVDALVRRRAVEKALFLQPTDGHIPAPSAVLTPKIDYAAYRMAPRTRPEEVDIPLDGDEAVALRPETAPEPLPIEQWSAPQAAAAAVSARLTELFPDDDADLDEDPALTTPGIEAPSDEPVEGEFLHAPASPPEPEEDAGEDETFPALDPDLQAEPALAFAAGAEPVEVSPEPVIDLAELQPFPEDAELQPPIAPEDQAEFDARFKAPPEPAPAEAPASPSEGFAHAPAGPSQGDPSALSEPLDGPNSGPFIYLFLGGLALLVAAAVTLVRTPDPGGESATGLGWILGLAGVAMVSIALWAIMGRENATGSDEDA
jgi:lysozyme